MNKNIQKQNFKVQVYVLVVGIILFLLKFLAYYWTYSVLILSDALESIVNLIAAVIGLYSLYLSARPKDISHPYGHGKIEFLTSGIEGGLIFFAGLTIIYESIQRLILPSAIHRLDIGLIFLFITAWANGITGILVKKLGKKNHNLQLISSGQHLITDAISTLAVCLGVLMIYLTEKIWLDSILGILVGIYILFPAYKIIRDAIAGIMDESDKKLIEKFIQLMKNHKNDKWIDLHNLKILKNGSIIHVDVHLTLPFYWTIQQANQEIQLIEKLIQTEFGELAECSVQIDGCAPNLCTFCSIQDCSERKQPFTENWKWEYEKITELH